MMQSEITNAIVKHIFKNLGIFTEYPVAVSICHDSFLLDKKITFQVDNCELFAPVWACQTSVENKTLNIICTSLAIDHEEHVNNTETFILVKLEGQPSYGCYLSSAGLGITVWDGFIAVELKTKSWIPTTTFLQATFLAGMEQLKDLSSKYDKSINIEELFTLLKSFIAYRESLISAEEVSNEG